MLAGWRCQRPVIGSWLGGNVPQALPLLRGRAGRRTAATWAGCRHRRTHVGGLVGWLSLTGGNSSNTRALHLGHVVG